MEANLIPMPDVDQIDTQANNALTFADALKIETANDYTAAGARWTTLAALAKEIKETFGPIKAKLHAAHKETVAQEKRHLDPVESAQKTIKQKMIGYDAEQERIRKAEEDRLRIEAQKQAEDEALRAAEQAEAAGESEVAESIIETPVAAPPVILPKSTPKVAGFKTQERYGYFEITDEKAIPREFLMVDEQKLRKYHIAMRKGANVPGVKFFTKTV